MPFLEKPDDVNVAQWDAIRYEGGHLLIVAGPGTGKTHTLTYRILHVIDRLTSGQKILALTFTNKAAKEMECRLHSRVNDKGDLITVGTFHSLCYRLLEQHHHFSHERRIHFASPEKIEVLAQDLWPNLKKQQRRQLLARISLWKATEFDQTPFPELLEYDRILQQKGFLDFDDLLLKTYQLFLRNKQVLKSCREKYPYIFVDEFQDINLIQHQLLRLLAEPSAIVTAIGDPYQAIYGFRGSDVSYFKNFKKHFPNAVQLTLSENYRSAQNIICASSQLIRAESTQRTPPLSAMIKEQGRLVIHEARTERAEAEFVVHQIEKCIGGTSLFSNDSGRLDHSDEPRYSFGDIAVLFRLNQQCLFLEEALDRSGIPYHITQEREYENPQEFLANVFKHGESQGKISLMTLHAAKGLEFAVVFIVGCEKDLLPLRRDGWSVDPDEDRRLFYVGVTRAKEKLYLVRAARRRLYGKIYDTQPSEFLSDIQEELKEYEKLEKKFRHKSSEDQMKLFS